MKLNRMILAGWMLSSVMMAQQAEPLVYSFNSRYHPGTGSTAPFLSTANQYDRHSFAVNSLSVWSNLYKPIRHDKAFDAGFGVELNGNWAPSQKRFFPGELYVEGKLGPFLANLGMKREDFGNQDGSLSSGGMIGSRNSRPLPALTIETDGWQYVPFTHHIVAFTGGMANGWFSDKTVTTNTLMHHKWLHLRTDGKLPVSFNYGLQHVAQWAGNSAYYGKSEATFDNFKRIFFGKNGSSNGPATERINALGNHLISQQVGLSLRLPSFTAEAYWQNLSEDGPILMPLYRSYNAEDGLFGLSLHMPKFKLVQGLVLEVLSTTDQSGPWHDLDGVIYGGTDSYYNNGVYPNGWSFYGMAIGNPFITSPKYNSNGGVSFQNNNLRMFYLSSIGALGTMPYRLTAAYSVNYGCPGAMYDQAKKQGSVQLEVYRDLPFWKGAQANLTFSADRGAMYGDNTALMLGLRYAGQIPQPKNH